MLLTAGVKHRGFEVAACMYMWQSRLWTEIVGAENIDEQAELSLVEQASYASDIRAIHIPWWRYIRDFTATAPQTDIVLCDGALAELTDVAFVHILKTAARVLSGSSIGAFVATTLGSLKQRR